MTESHAARPGQICRIRKEFLTAGGAKSRASTESIASVSGQ